MNENRSTSPKVNLVVGVNLNVVKSIFAEGKWYSSSERFAEIKDLQDNIRLIFFYTVQQDESRRAERQVAGYFAYPRYVGKVARDNIANRFLPSDTGNYDSLSADKGSIVQFPVLFHLPYLSSKTGERIWQISDEDALVILRNAHRTFLETDKEEFGEALRSLELMIEDLNDLITKQVSPKFELEREQLPDWLNKEIDDCDVSNLPMSKVLISRLLEQAKQNPLSELRASKLQMKSGDYKYILSLANYCYSRGWESLNIENFKEAYKYYFQAAILFHRDPMITSSDWKTQKRLDCISKCVESIVTELIIDNEGRCSYEELSNKARPRLEDLQKYLSMAKLQKYVRIFYHIGTINYLSSNGDSDGAYEIMSQVVDSDIKDDYPKQKLAKYYDELANTYRGKAPTLEALKLALAYKQKSLSISKELHDEIGSASSHISCLERTVDFYKIQALIADLGPDSMRFSSNIDSAIEAAIMVNDLYPAEHRKRNANYLFGFKYGISAKYANTFDGKADCLSKACYYLEQVDTEEAYTSFIFYQLLYYHYRLCYFICTKNDFDGAIVCAQEALNAKWANQGQTKLRPYLLAENHGLHLGVAMCKETVAGSDLEELDSALKRMRQENANIVYLRVVGLIYGLQLIRFNGINDPRIIDNTVFVIRSEIRQLLENYAVTFESVYDDMQIVMEKSSQSDVEEQILSKLRTRKVEENYEVEVKESILNRNTQKIKISDKFVKTIIAFLNSVKGGHLFIGIENDTYDVKGIDADLAKYHNSTDQFKLALSETIKHHLDPTLSKTWLPTIEILFPVVKQKTIVWVKIPPGHYMNGLYIDVDGVAYIKRDAHIEEINSPIDKDNLASQRREGKGLWSGKVYQ